MKVRLEVVFSEENAKDLFDTLEHLTHVAPAEFYPQSVLGQLREAVADFLKQYH